MEMYTTQFTREESNSIVAFKVVSTRSNGGTESAILLASSRFKETENQMRSPLSGVGWVSGTSQAKAKKARSDRVSKDRRESPLDMMRIGDRRKNKQEK
jgi:hypothetical protein